MEVKNDFENTQYVEHENDSQLKKYSEPKKDCEVKEHCEGGFTREKDWYRKKIVDMVDKIRDEKSIKRIYNLAEYLYIHK